MTIFGWVQNKLSGNQRNDKISNRASTNHHVKQEPAKKEEFSDWPQGLLTIGTFGNNDVPTQNPEIQQAQEEEDQSSSPDLQDFTQEEVGKLQKELIKLLKRKPSPSRSIDSKEIVEHPLNKFLNCPSSLEVDRRICESFRTNLTDAEKEEDLDRTINVILGRCKDVRADKGNKSIGKQSVSFLLKKMFVCTGGFSPRPRLSDSLSESRMEKLLRTMLQKNIKSQSSWPSSMNRVLEETQETYNINEDQRREKVNDGSTWVKTDSEYIVLEI